MKKFIGIMMVVVMMVLTIGTAMADRVVEDYPGSEVFTWVEKWLKAQKYEEFLNYNEVDENGYWRGYGVVCNSSFRDQYGVEFDAESAYEILKTEFDGLQIEGKTIGEYEGYDVFWMKVSANVPIGSIYRNGETVDYYAGEMVYMIAEK